MAHTRRRMLPACLVLVVSLSGLDAREANDGAPPFPDRWLQGYARTIAGDWIVYPWAYPGQAKTLLSRATTGAMAVEWEGEPAPPGPPDERLTYLWHGGTASGYGAHLFTLSVNGRPAVRFRSGRSAADRAWSIAGEGGAVLSFLTTRVGQFDELFGFMWLTAPRAFFGSGPPRFRVVGEAAGSQDYYLGPQERVEAWTRTRAEEAVFADGQRAISVGISRIGAPRPAAVRSGDRVLWTGTAQTGFTAVLVPAGPNRAATVPLIVEVDGSITWSDPISCALVAPRELHLLPHSHVDIGYSDPQPEVERKQWKNLRDAVGLATQTAAYPTEARFRWNVEGLWSVESYLAQATPAERRAFADAVRAGAVGLQANYTNILTGLATPAELRRWTDAARRVRTELGVGPIASAMHSDIPGLSWSAVSALAEGGVRYFSSGPNYMPGLPDGGDRIGGTLKAAGDRPFWWVSPSGEHRLLYWTAGRGYSWFHGLNTGPASERSRDAVLEYVKELVNAGYRYSLIQVRYTVGGDNGPVDPKLPDFVRRWNEQFSSPRLVINTADGLFAEFERRHGLELPVRAGDMTPYWEDGALSSAAEEASVRAAARRVQQAETLAALRGIALPASDRQEAWRNILLWHEHTWGAADSVSQPDRPDVVAQWEYKRRFALESDRLSRALVTAALPATPARAGFIDVINTLSWPRSGLVYLPASLSTAGDRVVVRPFSDGEAQLPDVATAQGGQRDVRDRLVVELGVPSQRLRDGRLAVWLDAVPAMSSVRLQVLPGTAQPPAIPVAASGTRLANGRVRVEVDRLTGALGSLSWDGAAGHDFVAGAPGLLQYLYVDGRDPRAAAAAGGGSLRVEEAGPLVATVRVDGPAGGTSGVVRRVTLVAGSDAVFADLHLDKTPVRTKESAHVAFPFRVPGGRERVDQGEALVAIPHEQLPGSCADFVGVQSAIDVSNDSTGITLVSLDAPLIELGALTDERQNDRGTRTWRDAVAPGSAVYAYLLNNYWHTNYKADQHGPLGFRFELHPHGAFDAVAMRRRSAEADYPLLTAAASDDAPALRPPFTLGGDPVVVSAVDAAAGSLLVRLYNPGAAPAQTQFLGYGRARLAVVTPDGERAADEGRVTVPGRATRVVRLSGR